ncbi:hypothetical protein KSC_013320 [Ktedonobacter sp. SOSP1-52]|nr:hypothetical protein KSC_013320 [Ktedonobacter sp. SOSP1-52]
MPLCPRMGGLEALSSPLCMGVGCPLLAYTVIVDNPAWAWDNGKYRKEEEP